MTNVPRRSFKRKKLMWNTKIESPDYNTEDRNVLSFYLQDIKDIPLLNREEENHLARLAAQGDTQARQSLAKAHLRFVVNIAKRYRNQGLPLSDIISEGNIGLLQAIERYDVDKGYHFISYAVWWIRQSILKAIYEKARMIRLPLNRNNELMQIKKVSKYLQEEHGRIGLNTEKVSHHLNMDRVHIEKLLNISRDLISLESPIHDNNDAPSVVDFVEDQKYLQPEEEMMREALKENMLDVLKTLPEKEYDIIVKRYGLNGQAPLSLQSVGREYHLTKERIRQIEQKGLSRLRGPSRRQMLEHYRY